MAQDYRGKIEGLITDDSKAVIGGASVTLLNVNTGIRVVRKTSDTGLYVFDLVDPGTYSITIEATGFNKLHPENIVVQTRGDVTVNATLKPGAVQESITVNDTPAAVEFNSANKDFTIDTKLVEEIPRFDRNPFKMTLIAPSAVNTRGEMQPYHSWSANSVDLGGGTNLKNDLQVDGMPIGMGQKNSTPPNTDAVQEVIVSTNSADAESGHSAGGLISMTTKSGTNEFHGTGFYVGRYPWLSAEADRTRFSSNSQRQNMYGGTLGNPIKKNKLFNFFSIEDWKVGYPNTYQRTLPTALEATGDFSQSLNIDGGQRTIFDPWTTVLKADGSVSVTPFAGNKIPQNRFDPLAATLIKAVLGAQQSRGQYHRSEQLHQRVHRELRVLQLLRPRGLQHQRQVEDLRAPGPVQHHRYRRQPDGRHVTTLRPHGHLASGLERGRRCHLDDEPAHRAGVPRRLAQPAGCLCFHTAGFGRMGLHLDEQCLVRALSDGFRRRAGLFPGHEYRRQRIRRRRLLLEPGSRRAKPPV